MSELFKHVGEDIKPEEVEDLGHYLAGYGAAMNNQRIQRCAEILLDAADHICAGGYWGCHGGKTCTSDHK